MGKRLFARLWKDESGAIISAEMALLGSVLVVGAVAGLSSLRDGVIEELADVGQAIGNTDQSFAVGGTQSASSGTAGFSFQDNRDFGDDGSLNANSRGLQIYQGGVVNGSDGGAVGSTEGNVAVAPGVR